ncbi:hypothetical protein ACFFX0_26995 [Citricoccus parietis]|uniref:Uncharacterized protein n=1 Tax=Citricoccus parietis TaxID=592307 RepID=A0ABV5G893_9MICC
MKKSVPPSGSSSETPSGRCGPRAVLDPVPGSDPTGRHAESTRMRAIAVTVALTRLRTCLTVTTTLRGALLA